VTSAFHHQLIEQVSQKFINAPNRKFLHAQKAFLHLGYS